MHSNARTETSVWIRLEAGEQFRYEGRTFLRGTEAAAVINYVSVDVVGQDEPLFAKIRGMGLSRGGRPLQIDRTFQAQFVELPAFIVQELQRQFATSVTGHEQAQAFHANAGAWATYTITKKEDPKVGAHDWPLE